MELKSIFKVKSWTTKSTSKGIKMPYDNERLFFDLESAEEAFNVQEIRTRFNTECSKNLKGFVTLQECKGIKGEISVGEELKRVEIKY